mmetsp:Transcript_31247/g.97200  ORF Transcript_31247/g.97200 Transcript_31247/m.97200 type:complete len:245 (+) Transcript_31247:201-935(+)
MEDPVSTVDGCVYERSFIEQWFRTKQQSREPLTSPATGAVLRSKLLLPLIALQKAIEVYMENRPELRRMREAHRSFEEAARLLQEDVTTKSRKLSQANANVARVKLIKDRFGKLQRDNSKFQRVTQGLLKKLRETRNRCSRQEDRCSRLEEDLRLKTQELNRAKTFMQRGWAFEEALIGQASLVCGRSARRREVATVLLTDDEDEDEVVDLELASPAKKPAVPVCAVLETVSCSPRSIEVEEGG